VTEHREAREKTSYPGCMILQKIMEPRNIIRRDTDLWSGEKPLTVLIDTPSMNEQVSYGNGAAHRFLRYCEFPSFDFIRTPEAARYSEIEKIRSYSFESDEKSGHRIIRIDYPDSGRREMVGFGYKEEDVRDIAGRVFEDKKEQIEAEVNPTEEQIETIRKAFIQASINRREAGRIFITEREILLSNRRWFENHFPGQRLNIMTIDEAVEYLGLYSRFREEYWIHPQYRVDKTLWYLHLFRSMVPRYHTEPEADDQYLQAFATRVRNLLVAVDEIGYQYFHEPDNKTQLNIEYHFDHAISLTTGSFDALALKTTVTHDIGEVNKEYISLSNNRGREFLRRVREENEGLRDHISKYMPYINLIYTIRPLILHRGGYQGTQLQSEDEDWISRMIVLDQLDEEDQERFFRYHREIEDESRPYDPISSWGLYDQQASNFKLLEPYHFIKAATKELIQFSDEYFRLLGYSEFFDELEDNSDFAHQSELIRENALTGFHREMQ
jgi:hypothetical protein